MINFIVVISMCIFMILSILSSTILNKQYVIKALEQSNYYEKTYYAIQDEFKNYIMQSGLEESVLENLYDKQKLKKDINQVIDGIYENKTIHISTQEMKQTLDNRINKILEKNNRRPEEEEKRSIQNFENTIIEVYVDNITYEKDYVEQIGAVYHKMMPIIQKAQIALVIVIIVLIATIMLINKNLRENIKMIGIAVLSSGILAIFLKLLLANKIDNLLILNRNFSQSLIYIVNQIISTFFVTGIAMTMIGLIAIILGSYNKKISINKNNSNKEDR